MCLQKNKFEKSDLASVGVNWSKLVSLKAKIFGSSTAKNK